MNSISKIATGTTDDAVSIAVKTIDVSKPVLAQFSVGLFGAVPLAVDVAEGVEAGDILMLCAHVPDGRQASVLVRVMYYLPFVQGVEQEGFTPVVYCYRCSIDLEGLAKEVFQGLPESPPDTLAGQLYEEWKRFANEAGIEAKTEGPLADLLSSAILLGLNLMTPTMGISADDDASPSRTERLYDGSNGERFNPFDLMEWINLASRVGVPFVSAYVLARIKTDDALNLDFDLKPLDAVVSARDNFISGIQDDKPGPYIFRWSVGAHDDIKQTVSEGYVNWGASFNPAGLFSESLFERIYQFPAEQLDFLWRPWVQPLMIDNIPVEFRVFVRNGQLVGVASRHPGQRTGAIDRFPSLMDECVRLASRLVDGIVRPMELPMVDDPGIDKNLPNVCIDFIVTKDREVLLLDGNALPLKTTLVDSYGWMLDDMEI